MATKLTDAAVRALAARDERYDVQEPGGLGVRVGPSGRKTWQVLYSFEGRRRRLALGEYPAVTLAEARRRAAEARARVAEGVDPAAERAQAAEQRDAEARERSARPTLAEFWAREFRPRAGARYAESTLELIDYLWRTMLGPTVGSVRVAEITRRDCVLAIDAAEARGPAAAAKAQRLLGAVLREAADRAVIDASPAERLPRRQTERARSRALDDDEIRALLADLDRMQASFEVRAALRLILLTGQRPGEVCGMEWGELDFAAAVWRIPADRMKARRAHAVPLSRQVLGLLDVLRTVGTSTTHVLPGRYRPGSGREAPCVVVESLSAALRRDRAERPAGAIAMLDPFTPHDLRRTCRTGLAALGVDHVVAERVLAHQIAGVAGVYDRHDYVPEMRAALQRWADHVDRIVSGEALGNVVEMRGR